MACTHAQSERSWRRVPQRNNYLPTNLTRNSTFCASASNFFQRWSAIPPRYTEFTTLQPKRERVGTRVPNLLTPFHYLRRAFWIRKTVPRQFETNDGDGRPFILIVLATDPFVPKHRLRGRLIRTSHSRTQRTTQMTKFARTTLSILSPELPT